MAAFGGLADRAAHGIKNQLNAVAVNVEVVRARSARGGDAVAVASFADTAANEFERSATVVEALLALVRPEREPVDVGTLLARFVTLNQVATEAPAITVRRLDDGTPVTTAPGTAVRVA